MRKKIVEFKLIDDTYSRIVSTKKTTFPGGTHRKTELIRMITTTRPTAVLECGHTYNLANFGIKKGQKTYDCFMCNPGWQKAKSESNIQ